MDVTLIIDPRHAEDDLPLRLAQALDQTGFEVSGVPLEHDMQRLEHFGRSLVEFGFTCVAGLDLLVDLFDAVRCRHAHLPDSVRIL